MAGERDARAKAKKAKAKKPKARRNRHVSLGAAQLPSGAQVRVAGR
jgi:hypothetical protein